MKKLLFFVAVLWASIPAFADNIQISFGALTLTLPFQTVSGCALWDFIHKQGLGGVETPLATYKHFTLNGGAVTSVSGQGTPFLELGYDVQNPIENFAPIANFHPGIFGGYDFNAQPGSNGKKQPWIVGLHASIQLW